MSGAAKTRKPRAPKPAQLLPLQVSREAMALQANLDEARAQLRQRRAQAEPDDISGAMAHRASLAGLGSEIERLEQAIHALGFAPEPEAAASELPA